MSSRVRIILTTAERGWSSPSPVALNPGQHYGEWKDVLVSAGVREARLHDARHTAATFLLVLGVAQRAVMDVMGWSKISMAQRYQHVPDDLRRNIASQVGGLLWKTPNDDEDGSPKDTQKAG